MKPSKEKAYETDRQKCLAVASKILYILPAVLWDGIWLFILMIAGWKEASLLAWLYPILPTAAAVLLWKGKWWGCVPGIAMGVILMTLVANEEASGMGYCIYFVLMGLICAGSAKKE